MSCTDRIEPDNVVSFPPAGQREADRRPGGRPSVYVRSAQALLFTDFAGYSKLNEAQVAIFQFEIMERFAELLERYAEHVRCRNSWGDALFVAFDDPSHAARLCFELRAAVQAVDFEAMGLTPLSRMRCALHFGTVFRSGDPLLGRDNCFGTEVSRAARLEPRTPPGATYATEAFVSELTDADRARFGISAVGPLEIDPAMEPMLVYSLSDRTGPASARDARAFVEA